MERAPIAGVGALSEPPGCGSGWIAGTTRQLCGYSRAGQKRQASPRRIAVPAPISRTCNANSRRIPLFPELKQSTSRANGQVDWDNIGVTVLLRAAVPWSAVGGKSAAPSAAGKLATILFSSTLRRTPITGKTSTDPAKIVTVQGRPYQSLELSLHVQRLPFLGSLLRTSSVEIEMRPKKEFVITARLRGLDATPAMARINAGSTHTEQ